MATKKSKTKGKGVVVSREQFDMMLIRAARKGQREAVEATRQEMYDITGGRLCRLIPRSDPRLIPGDMRKLFSEACSKMALMVNFVRTNMEFLYLVSGTWKITLQRTEDPDYRNVCTYFSRGYNWKQIPKGFLIALQKNIVDREISALQTELLQIREMKRARKYTGIEHSHAGPRSNFAVTVAGLLEAINFTETYLENGGYG